MAETATPGDTRPAAPAASRWLALVVFCAGMLMIVLDQTIVIVALPSIRGDLGFSQSGLAWVVNAYLIAFGALLLAGRQVSAGAGLSAGDRERPPMTD